MAYEKNSSPPRVHNVPPQEAIKPTEESDAEYWDQHKKAMRSKREYLEEERMADRLAEPEPPPEPPFKVTGSVNLGNFDLQAQQNAAEERAERERKEAAAKVEKAQQEAAAAKKELSDNVNQQLLARIDALQAAYVSNNKADFFNQMTAVKEAAVEMGFTRDPAPTDSQLSIEIKKLEAQIAKENRDFQRQMKQDERMWQLKIRELDQQAKDAEARLQVEREKFSALYQIPERVGGVIARGLIDSAEMEETGGGHIATGETPKESPRSYTAEADVGEAGDFPCPSCKTPIGIGPTSKTVECANCHSRVKIKRAGV